MTEEKRFFNVQNYNNIRIVNELKRLIKTDGGELIERGHKYIICARTNDTDEKKRAAVEALPPVKWSGYDFGGASLYFVLDGFYYSISYDSNPFFPIIYGKIKIDERGNYTGKRIYFSSEDINERSWKKNKTIDFSIAYDDSFKICDDERIEELARDQYEQIKKFVINGAECPRESKKKRVYNHQNNGYHYERIYDNTKRTIYA